MKMAAIGLVLAGALLAPVPAGAAEVSEEKQAQLDANGWTVHDSAEDVPIGFEADVAHCPHSGRARRIASAIRDYKNDVLVRARNKLAVCANNGQVTWSRGSVTYASPGKPRWTHVSGPYRDLWHCCDWRSYGIRSQTEWAFHGVIDEYWRLNLKLTAHVEGDHRITFTAKRRWF
jgi:hypothetical protein